MGKRWLEATGPLPSSGPPNGSMTRPINPSPTGTSITRPVRSTSSPACRCSHSPSSTTPISSESTLNAMPYRSPGNFTSSSKPTPGRPETLAMPMETLVIVPTSRGVNCGVKASSVRLIPANAWSKMLCRLSGELFNGPPLGPHGPPVQASGLASGFGSGLASAFGSGLASAFGSGLASAFGSGLDFGRSASSVQKFAGALFQRREIIRDAPGHLLSVGGEFDAADQLRRGLELDLSVRGEGFLHRTFDRALLCRRQIERAMHAHRVVRRLEGGRQLLLGRAGQAHARAGRKRRPCVPRGSCRRGPPASFA